MKRSHTRATLVIENAAPRARVAPRTLDAVAGQIDHYGGSGGNILQGLLKRTGLYSKALVFITLFKNSSKWALISENAMLHFH